MFAKEVDDAKCFIEFLYTIVEMYVKLPQTPSSGHLFRTGVLITTHPHGTPRSTSPSALATVFLQNYNTSLI